MTTIFARFGSAKPASPPKKAHGPTQARSPVLQTAGRLWIGAVDRRASDLGPRSSAPRVTSSSGPRDEFSDERDAVGKAWDVAPNDR